MFLKKNQTKKLERAVLNVEKKVSPLQYNGAPSTGYSDAKATVTRVPDDWSRTLWEKTKKNEQPIR